MKPRVSIAIAAVLAVSGISSATWAADKAGVGKLEYQSNCASCHGNDGKGGAYVDFLKVTPPDRSSPSTTAPSASRMSRKASP